MSESTTLRAADWPVPVPAPVLVGAQVRLVPLAPEHDAALLAAASDPRTWAWMSRDVGSPEKLRAYLDAARAEVAAGTSVRYAVETQADQRIVGMVLLKDLSRRDRRAEAGTWLHPDAWGTGVNEEAKRLLLGFAFETLGCLRVEFTVALANTRSRAALLRIGAAEEGVLRSRRLGPDGRRFDQVMYSVLDRDWPHVRAQLEARAAAKRGGTHNSAPAGFDPDRDAMVAVWDELSFWSAPVGQLLLDAVPLDSTRALDLGCGAGFPAFELAERLGAHARVIGLDPWTGALRRAQLKRATLPVPNVELVSGDGAALPFRSGAFDLVVSNLGVNNFDRPAEALAECRRVLRRGGTLALGSNLAGHFAELYAAFDAVLARDGDEAARERLRTHVAHRATIAGLTAMLAPLGFRVVATPERATPWRFRDSAALFAHHLIRWGFLPAWREVAGEARADERLLQLGAELDARSRAAGEIRLTVPFAAVVARVD